MSLTESEFFELLKEPWTEISPSVLKDESFWGSDGLVCPPSSNEVLRFEKSSSLFKYYSRLESISKSNASLPCFEPLFSRSEPSTASMTGKMGEAANSMTGSSGPLLWKMITSKLHIGDGNNPINGYVLCVTDYSTVWVSRASREEISKQYKSYVDVAQRSRTDTIRHVIEAHILKMLLPQFQSEDLSELFDKEITGLSNESNTFNNLSESRSSLNHVFYSNDSTQASQTSSSDNQLTPTERKPCAVLCSFLLVGNYTSHWAFHLQKLANISSDEAKVENMTLDSEQPTASPIPSSCLIGQDAQKAFLTRQLYYPSWYGRQYSSQQVALLGHALEKTYSTNQGTHSLSSTKTGQTAMILPFHPNEIMVDEHNIQEQLVHSSPVISQQTQYPSPYSTQAFQTVTNHSNPSSGSSSSSNSNSSLSSYSAHSSADSSTNSSAGNSYSSLVPNNRQYYDAQFSPPETQTEFISTTISKTLHALRSKITISSKNVTAIMMIINAYFDQQYGDYLAKIEQKYKTKETGKNKRPILLPSIRGIVAVNSKQNVWSPNVPLLHGNPDDIFARYLHKHRHPGFMLYRPIETQLVLSELTPPTHLPTSLHIVWSAIPQTQATVASKSQNTTVSDLSVTLPDTDVTRNRTILYSREDNASLELPCISDDLPEPAPSSDVQELSSNPSHDVPVNHEEMTDLPMPNQANDAPLPAKRFVNATLSRVNLKKRRF